ncbi:MAG: hypothetical protein E6G61_09485 [Actinobacteria bacterium]|nr:MAG: hypothetical protein E6G61_09485 [Actinomycetota bacterium]
MHAVVVTVSIEPGHAEEAKAQLETNVLPRAKETPWVVSGYWTRSPDGEHGFSMVIFENEEAARAAADNIPNLPTPDFVTFDNIEVREVVAHF